MSENQLAEENDQAVRLKAIEEKVFKRMQELGNELKLPFWPDAGMILAAEGVESRFSLGSSIVKAVWEAELSDEQLAEIKSKLTNKFRLFEENEEELQKDILKLGQFLTRVQIDLKKIFAKNPELKIALLTELLSSMEVILAEYQTAQSGAERSLSVKEYLQHNLTVILSNIKEYLQSDFFSNKEILEKAGQRYQILFDEIQDLDPAKLLTRKEILELRDALRSILVFNLQSVDELDSASIASDEDFAQIVERFRKLKND